MFEITSLELTIFYIFLCLIVSSILAYLLLTSIWFKRICLGFCIPGPPALPIIGNCSIAADTEALLDIAARAYEDYGPVFRIWISFIPVFVIVDPKVLQNVLPSSKNTNKNFFYTLMLNFLGTGLLTISGHKWKKHRKLLQPSFNLNILETFVGCFSDSSTILVEKLGSMVEREINITKFINSSVINVLNEAILGIPVQQNILNNSPYTQGKPVSQERIIKPWLLFDFLFSFTKSGKMENSQKKNLTSFTRQIIEQRKGERKLGIFRTDRTSLLERMLDIQEENPDFTDEDIENEVSTFMLAGQESVATTISFCLFCIGKYNDIQNKIYDEQCTIFSDSSRLPTMNDLQEMVYLEQCIKETLRMYPTVPVFARELGESIKIGEHILPVGTNILITPYITQRLKHIYPNSTNFDPERFTIDNSEKRAPYSFIPFSAGPRNCIGNKFAMLEMKTIISTIIRNYKLVVNPEYNVKISFRVTLRAKGGIWMTLKPRKTNNYST